MKVIKKQKNSKNCVLCGLYNPYGIKANFYEMENVEEKMALGLFGTFKNSKLEGKMAAIGSYSLLSYLNLEVPENKNDFS